MTGLSDAVIRVVALALSRLLVRDELHTILTDHYRRGTSLACVSLHCFLDGFVGGGDGFSEGFFIDRHLDSDMWELVVDGGFRRGFVGGVIFRVLVKLDYRPDDLSNKGDDEVVG